MNFTFANGKSSNKEFYLEEKDIEINRYISILGFFLCSVAAIIQCIILYYFGKKRKILTYNASKIQINIGICLLIQHITHMVSSMCGIINESLPPFIDVVCASLVQGALFAIISLISLLTINAFDVIYGERFFSSIDRNKFFKYCNYICLIFGVVMTIFYILPPFSLSFNLYYLGYEFKADSNSFNLGSEIENKFVVSFLTISFIIYIFIFIEIYRTRKLNKINKKRKFYWSDVKFLAQTIFNFIFYLIIDFSWNYGDKVFYKSRYFQLFSNFLFNINNLCNTILIGLIIGEIRTKLIGLFLCRNFKKPMAVKLCNTTK
uniref:7TM_GPCR_Srx domain-containing protein n=1 Tax=Strongyloides venezuelensis TaxID=75913 RepID=A0A0K0F4C6_STRVS